MISLIVARSSNNVIGTNDNKLPWYIPADLEYFKTLTAESTVIMGKNTFMSLPFKNGLPNRKNIVVSKTFKHENVDSVETIIDAIEMAKIFGKKIWVIGGSMLYDSFLSSDLIDYCYITEVDIVIDDGTMLPKFNFDSNKYSLLSSTKYKKNKAGDYDIKFDVYKRIKTF
jgi:dihydrofolate reductase